MTFNWWLKKQSCCCWISWKSWMCWCRKTSLLTAVQCRASAYHKASYEPRQEATCVSEELAWLSSKLCRCGALIRVKISSAFEFTARLEYRPSVEHWRHWSSSACWTKEFCEYCTKSSDSYLNNLKAFFVILFQISSIQQLQLRDNPINSYMRSSLARKIRHPAQQILKWKQVFFVKQPNCS